jgi:hypothetical protein
VFDEDAGVFDYEEACSAGFRGGVLVFDSLLHPDDFCADGDGAVDYRRDVIGAAKDVNDFDVVGFRYVFEARVGFFAEHFGFVGIYRDDAVAGGLYVLSDAETGASGIGREADYRDGFIVFEDIGDYVIAVWPVIGDGSFHSDVRYSRAPKLSRSSLGIGAEGLVGTFPLARICGSTWIGGAMRTRAFSSGTGVLWAAILIPFCWPTGIGRTMRA